MASIHPAASGPGLDEAPQADATHAAPSADDGTQEGTWAVVVSSLSVVTTFVASAVLFKGYLALARLPGPVPALDKVPDTAATQGPMQWMQTGGWIFGLAAVLAIVGLVAGIRLVRSPRAYSRGVWAIALAACTPVLAIMLLSGMGAT